MSDGRRGRPTKVGAEVNEILRALGAKFAIEDLPEHLPQELPEMAPTPTDEERLATRARALLRDERHGLGWPLRAINEARIARTDVQAIREIDRIPSGATFVVISGPVGVGKTVAVAWWALRCSYVTRFVRATTMSRTSRYSDEWSDMLRCDAIAIDDLGTEYADKHGSFAVDVDELIDTYVNDGRPLFVTTNLNQDAFCERYGRRNADRLRESGHWIQLGGKSLRGRNAGWYP